jgi:hypothetical protein
MPVGRQIFHAPALSEDINQLLFMMIMREDKPPERWININARLPESRRALRRCANRNNALDVLVRV